MRIFYEFRFFLLIRCNSLQFAENSLRKTKSAAKKLRKNNEIFKIFKIQFFPLKIKNSLKILDMEKSTNRGEFAANRRNFTANSLRISLSFAAIRSDSLRIAAKFVDFNVASHHSIILQRIELYWLICVYIALYIIYTFKHLNIFLYKLEFHTKVTLYAVFIYNSRLAI